MFTVAPGAFLISVSSAVPPAVTLITVAAVELPLESSKSTKSEAVAVPVVEAKAFVIVAVAPRRILIKSAKSVELPPLIRVTSFTVKTD